MSKLVFLVFHCTATPEGREVTSDEIKKWHTSPVSQGGRGWKQVGYTDMFHLDGSVERLVNNNEDSNVDSWEITNGVAGINGISRHVVYVGGVAKDGKTSKDTRTLAQKISMKKYALEFFAKNKETKGAGHNQFAAKACPSFDVKAWLYSIGINILNIYK